MRKNIKSRLPQKLRNSYIGFMISLDDLNHYEITVEGTGLKGMGVTVLPFEVKHIDQNFMDLNIKIEYVSECDNIAWSDRFKYSLTELDSIAEGPYILLTKKCYPV